MAEIDTIVQVSITANSKTPSRQGFGTPLVMTYHTRFAENFRVYTDTAGMISDGFTSVDDAYRKAKAIFAQNPTVTSIVVGRLPSAPVYRTQVNVTSAVAGQHVKLKVIAPVAGTLTDPAVSGGTISPTGALLAGAVVFIDYVIPAAQTLTQVATAVELLIEAVPGVDSTSSVAAIVATPTTAGRKVHVYDVVNAGVEDITVDAGYPAALDALQIENDDWYFVSIDSASAANIAAVASWTLSKKKLFFANVHNSSELDGTGTIGSDLLAAGNNRTALLFSFNSQEMAAEAWFGGQGSKAPGSVNWANKTLVGVTAKTLTSTQLNNLTADNINHYTPVTKTTLMVREGKTADGDYIDIRHGIDALEADIKESVLALIANTDKVPFTASGLDLISNAILGALKRFEGSEEQPSLIAIGTSVVLMPKLASISGADKQARRLTGVRFSGNLAGAINFVSIVGTLSV